jgi:hypothetical protein
LTYLPLDRTAFGEAFFATLTTATWFCEVSALLAYAAATASLYFDRGTEVGRFAVLKITILITQINSFYNNLVEKHRTNASNLRIQNL